MPQRGRKSSAALDVPAPDGTPPPLRPPASLNKTEAKIFVDLVEAADKKHFRASDAPLLAAYARAIRFESYAAAALTKDPTDTKAMSLWEKSSRAMVALSARLRLAPQARLTAKTVGRQGPRLPVPWE